MTTSHKSLFFFLFPFLAFPQSQPRSHTCIADSTVYAATEMIYDSISIPIRGSSSQFQSSLEWTDIQTLPSIREGEIRCLGILHSKFIPGINLSLRYNIINQDNSLTTEIRTPLSSSRNFICMVYAYEEDKIRTDSIASPQFRKELENARLINSTDNRKITPSTRFLRALNIEDIHITPEYSLRDPESIYDPIKDFIYTIEEGIRRFLDKNTVGDTEIELQFNINETGTPEKFSISYPTTIDSSSTISKAFNQMKFNQIPHEKSMIKIRLHYYHPDQSSRIMPGKSCNDFNPNTPTVPLK